MRTNKLIVTALLAAGLVVLAGGVSRGGVLRVDTNGVGDGSTWALASSLSNALANAQGGDELWIAKGTYANNWDGTNSFRIATNVTLYGGFTNGMGSLAERDWTNYPTILSGANTCRVVIVTSTNTVFDGLTVQSGSMAGNGGGLYKDTTGTLELANCTIVSNKAIGGYDRRGFGCYFANGMLKIRNCAFRDNFHGEQCSGALGVGLYASNANVVLDGCTFTNNYVWGRWSQNVKGGAFYCNGGTLSASNCVFVKNLVYGGQTPAGGGGGCVEGACSTAIRNCIFRDNQAPEHTVQSSYEAYGGALFVAVSATTTVEVENCTFAGNSAYRGGGAIYESSGKLIVKSCTIVGNNAVDKGGACYLGPVSANVAIENSILWSNDAATADEIYNGAGTASIAYSCLTGTGGDDLFGTMSLGPLMTNNPLFASATDLHLKSTAGRWDPAAGTWTTDPAHSPCIDVGNPVSDYALEPVNNGGRVNLGAYGNTVEASKSPSAVAPEVEKRGVVVLYNSADISGQLVVGTLSDVTLYYGTNAGNLESQSSIAIYPPPLAGGVFQAHVTGLLPNTTYYYAWYATNAAGFDWTLMDLFTSGSEPPGGGAAIIHVDKDAAGARTGRNWQDAFKTITEGLASANSLTNEIWVANGTYAEGELIAASDLSLYGWFTGGETSRSQRASGNEVVLDGVGLNRVMKITGTNVILDGLKISNGAVAGNGGGLYKDTTGTLELANCTIVSNKAIGGYDRRGFGCYFANGMLKIRNCAFRDNFHGEQCSGALGVGLYASNANVVLDGCTFTNNYVWGRWSQNVKGGAFYCNGGTLSASNCVFVKNLVYGGQTPAGGGGGCVEGACSTAIRNCIFRDNQAPEHTVQSSYEAYGGALFVAVSATTTVKVENCTFAGNSAYRGAGALYAASGILNIKNSILWTNTAANGAEVFATNASSSMLVSYSDLTGTNAPHVVTGGGAAVTWGNGILTTNPLFAVPYTDLHLKSRYGRWDPASGQWTNDAVTSPCIDAGDPASDRSNEPYPNGRRVNLGAYGNTAEASKSRVAGSVFVVQ